MEASIFTNNRYNLYTTMRVPGIPAPRYIALAERICEANGTTLTELNAAGRDAWHATLRAYIAWRCKQAGCPMYRICKILQRTSGTIQHMCNRAGWYMEYNDSLIMGIKQTTEQYEHNEERFEGCDCIVSSGCGGDDVEEARGTEWKY